MIAVDGQFDSHPHVGRCGNFLVPVFVAVPPPNNIFRHLGIGNKTEIVISRYPPAAIAIARHIQKETDRILVPPLRRFGTLDIVHIVVNPRSKIKRLLVPAYRKIPRQIGSGPRRTRWLGHATVPQMINRFGRQVRSPWSKAHSADVLPIFEKPVYLRRSLNVFDFDDQTCRWRQQGLKQDALFTGQ